MTRRHFFGRTSAGIGTAALASLFQNELRALPEGTETAAGNGLPGLPHFAPKAKRVIYLFQSGAPSQMELFDYSRNSPNFSARSCRIRSGRTSGSPA
jgi:hypothetical protein